MDLLPTDEGLKYHVSEISDISTMKLIVEKLFSIIKTALRFTTRELERYGGKFLELRPKA